MIGYICRYIYDISTKLSLYLSTLGVLYMILLKTSWDTSHMTHSLHPVPGVIGSQEEKA